MQLDNYLIKELLGKGTFGEVYLTTKKDSNLLYATKKMPKSLVDNPEYNKYFINEICILKQLCHKNIIKLEELKRTTNNYYVIMEYCNGGNLTECLEKYKNIHHKPFNEEIVQHIMRQLVSAINYIHGLGIIHRDLKLDNVLVKFENEEDKNQLNLLKSEIKIIDFGFAAYKNQTGLFTTAVGSPMNMDPLILKKFNATGSVNKELGYDEKADIWSLGTLCYQMLIGSCTFDAYNMKELVFKIEEGNYRVPIDLSKEVVSFLNAMIQYEPQKRLSASELIKHAFLIRDIKDFTRIDVKKVPNKVYGGKLIINIKDNKTIWSIFNEEDEKNLNQISGKLFSTETPISESQYLVGLNNPLLIKKDPFEQNILELFQPVKSIPLEGGIKNGMQYNSSPIPGISHNTQNKENNDNYKNSEDNIIKTPISKNNNNNNLIKKNCRKSLFRWK